METAPIPFQKMVFVCINKRANGEACCADGGGESIAAEIKARVKAMGLAGRIRVSKSGCQDVCAQGPSVMVFPEQRWYHHVRMDDVERIVAELIRELPPTPE